MIMRSTIYLMSWTNNPHFYIGQSQNFRARKSQHLCKLRKGLHSNKILQNVFNKYGEPQFQVLEYCEIEELNTIEQWYLNEFVGKENCLNIAKDAYVASRGLKRTDEIKAKLSKAQTGRKHSIATKEKMSLAQKNKTVTTLTREKLKQANIGKRNSNCWIPVLQWTLDNQLIKQWDCISDAAKAVNIHSGKICDCCKGKRKTVRGFKWTYVESHFRA